VGTFETSELERVAAAALTGADPFGRPVSVRAWSDASAILIIARCDAARTPPRGRSRTAGVAKLQHDVAATFYLRTGELLAPCGRSADPRRGLLVLAFERVGADSLDAHRGSGGRAPLADAS
jgi:hypothetical protein